LLLAIGCAELLGDEQTLRKGWIGSIDATEVFLLATSGTFAWSLFVIYQLRTHCRRNVEESDLDFERRVELKVGDLRNLLTRMLRGCNNVALFLLGIGVLDGLSYALAYNIDQNQVQVRLWLSAALAAAGAMVVALRGTSESLQRTLASTSLQKTVPLSR